MIMIDCGENVDCTSDCNSWKFQFQLEQEQELLQNLDEVNAKIDNYKKLEKELKERSYREDDLDDFMSNLTSEKLIDKTEIRKLRVSFVIV